MRGPRIFGFLAVFLVAALAPSLAPAQELSIGFGENGSITGTSIQLIALITVLSVAPGLAIMITCFPMIVTVLSILRQGIGLQQSPPNMFIVSLALFLTYFVMEPVFEEAWRVGISPMISEQISAETGLVRALDPFRDFMAGRLDLSTFEAMAALRPDYSGTQELRDSPMSILIPSFLLSEISRAFQIGFLVFLPFLIIDIVVAAVLMSMGMMMVPPALVSLPFKLSFFVLADGWSLISASLVSGYL
ncbi:MAG: flagellar biosynthetic protein FliP [Rhodobacteraceae bacterium HLUCCO07]|nr:MAG: flagellar biosynthetic protein FliP [Rhodobacteraceae bacterium HLUCCO07]